MLSRDLTTTIPRANSAADQVYKFMIVINDDRAYVWFKPFNLYARSICSIVGEVTLGGRPARSESWQDRTRVYFISLLTDISRSRGVHEH